MLIFETLLELFFCLLILILALVYRKKRKELSCLDIGIQPKNEKSNKETNFYRITFDKTNNMC